MILHSELSDFDVFEFCLRQPEFCLKIHSPKKKKILPSLEEACWFWGVDPSLNPHENAHRILPTGIQNYVWVRLRILILTKNFGKQQQETGCQMWFWILVLRGPWLWFCSCATYFEASNVGFGAPVLWFWILPSDSALAEGGSDSAFGVQSTARK